MATVQENEDKNTEPENKLEQENRQAKVIAFYSKGMTQAEIAEVLGVNQSTVSRDLQQLRQQARKKIQTYLSRDMPFEYHRCLAGVDEITKRIWGIAIDSETSDRDKLAALSLLMQCRQTRIEALVGDAGAKYYVKEN